MDLARVETERLVGCRPLARDAEELHEVLASPLVAEWLWPGELGGIPSLPKVRTILVRDMDHWKRHGFGAWVVRDRTTGALVGRVGLGRTHVAGADEVEVAWAIAPERWGQGLATEMAEAAVQAGLGPLGLPSVVAFTLPHNRSSRRVMERIGMTYERDCTHAGLPHVLYRRSGGDTLSR